MQYTVSRRRMPFAIRRPMVSSPDGAQHFLQQRHIGFRGSARACKHSTAARMRRASKLISFSPYRTREFRLLWRRVYYSRSGLRRRADAGRLHGFGRLKREEDRRVVSTTHMRHEIFPGHGYRSPFLSRRWRHRSRCWFTGAALRIYASNTEERGMNYFPPSPRCARTVKHTSLHGFTTTYIGVEDILRIIYRHGLGDHARAACSLPG